MFFLAICRRLSYTYEQYTYNKDFLEMVDILRIWQIDVAILIVEVVSVDYQNDKYANCILYALRRFAFFLLFLFTYILKRHHI